jgi:protein TonB
MDDEIKNKEDSSKIAYGVEVMPQFPGGEKRLLQFIRDNLNYPYAAADLGMQGRVDIRFIVTATGELTDIRVIKSLNPVLDAVAVRTVRKMPNWIPGIQNGKAVPVYYILPIIFTLQQ